MNWMPTAVSMARRATVWFGSSTLRATVHERNASRATDEGVQHRTRAPMIHRARSRNRPDWRPNAVVTRPPAPRGLRSEAQSTIVRADGDVRGSLSRGWRRGDPRFRRLPNVSDASALSGRPGILTRAPRAWLHPARASDAPAIAIPPSRPKSRERHVLLGARGLTVPRLASTQSAAFAQDSDG